MITPDDIAACQADQLTAMWDRCVIRQADSWVGETLTEGVIAWQWDNADQIPCRVAADDTQPRLAVVGGETVINTTLIVTLPVAICPTENQVITVIAAAIDPGLAGRRFDVKTFDPSTFATARRVRCTEHT